MRKTCIRMKMSDDGRILIPKGLRNGLGILPGQEFDISYNSETQKIEMEQCKDRCSICGETKELTTFEDIMLCNKCLAKIK